MHTHEYVSRDGTALASLLASGEVSPAEVADAATDAHDRTHQALGAVLEWYDEPAPSSGAGPWAGVPALRKDYGATEQGRLTERGSRLSAGWRAGTTSPLFRRLAELGVVVRGRAAVPEFILHATTESRLAGVTVNPWNPAFSAGGSSGGSAAAVAAGVVPFAHGSDCAGSLRIPAAVCGLVGLKPTRGRIPWGETVGVRGWGGIAEEFVLTRSVRDAAFLLAALESATLRDQRDTQGGGAATSRADSTSIRRDSGRETFGRNRLGAAALPGLPNRPLRIGVVVEHWAGAAVDPVLEAALASLSNWLDQAGHRVSLTGWPLPYERLAALMDPLFGLAAKADIEWVGAQTKRPLDATTLEPLTLEYLDALRALPATAAADAQREAARVTEQLDGWRDAFDIVMCSTLGRASLPLGRLGGEVSLPDWVSANDAFTPHSFVANVTGWPALSFPWGKGPHGIPIGIQGLAGRGDDELLLGLAASLDHAAPPLGLALLPALHWPDRDQPDTPGSTQSIS